MCLSRLLPVLPLPIATSTAAQASNKVSKPNLNKQQQINTYIHANPHTHTYIHTRICTYICAHKNSLPAANGNSKRNSNNKLCCATTSNKQNRKTSIQFGEDNELEKSLARTTEKVESRNHVNVSVCVCVSVFENGTCAHAYACA